MRRVLALSLCVVACEAVTGLDDLEYVPESCEPNSIDVTCSGVVCGSVSDNCGNEVICPDTCSGLSVCELNGAPANTCGCTGPPFDTPALPEGCTSTLVIGQHTYYFCEPKDHADARLFCQSFGTDLVIIDDMEENNQLVENFVAKSWIGLVAQTPCPEQGCVFNWIDGTVLDDTSFMFWNDLEPNNTNGGEHCVEMVDQLNRVGRWNDVPCTNVVGVICETTCE